MQHHRPGGEALPDARGSPCHREVMELAKEIASKDPDALTACKDGYRLSLEMSAEAALTFAAAKSDQLTLRQKDSWQSEGIADFLEGKYRLGAHDKLSG
ncbi:MAG: feruloyl-CoA hydratase/lyase [Alphaproteobacteria bacterium]|jgi:trans-feruloyl-CoA hydratase/vanillin synthase|nr:feruloyl-CoA hydratase/lyase [Alphaproteobacteria bacterium]